MNSQRIFSRLHMFLIVGLVISLGLSSLPLSQANASATIEVNSFADVAKNDGTCSLREAVNSANKDTRSGSKKGECAAGNGSDTIVLPAGIYTLTRSDSGNEDSNSTGDLDITSDITIMGSGVGSTIVNTNDGFNDRIFHVLNGHIVIRDLTLQGGNVKGDGGVIANLGLLELSNLDISGGNASNGGGGISNVGDLTITSSTISGNSAESLGGGLFNQGSLSMSNVTISFNSVSAEGGGGGGLYSATGVVEITSVTMSGNGLSGSTGKGGNLYVADGTVSLKNTLLANSTGGDNCFGLVNSLGNNLSDDISCASSFSALGDLNNVNARLGDLKDNGGFTYTHALLVGSPAIDSGDNAACPATDQRGVSRPIGLNCDIGAYETGGNFSWNTALQVTPGVTVSEYIDQLGQSRWYKFSIQPNSKVIVTLTNMPANYDLTLYKDIAAAYNEISSTDDLPRLDAEFAPDVFSPDVFSPDAFSPDAFSPDAFSPDVFSPDVFSPDVFSPDVFSPDVFSPDVFSPDVFSPDAFSPDVFSPDVFSPDVFSPDAFSPDVFSPDAFSGAQTRSLIAVSAFEGVAGEGILVNTWDNSGDFYVRVRGRNGNFSLTAPYDLNIQLFPGPCENVSDQGLPSPSLLPSAGNYKTVILVDSSRMVGTVDDLNLMWSKLDLLAQRPEVMGVVVDVNQDARVVAANAQADLYPSCPYAKNLVGEAIKQIVQGYWDLNPLEYVVIVGGDDVIPFFRYTDHAMLANEKNYAPPVLDDTSSQASLKLGYFLSQDRYGSSIDLSLKVNQLPLPDLGIGRLVETAAQVNTMLDAYLSTLGGVISTPTSSLVTGYDFLEDAALAVQAELEAGTGIPSSTLITPRDVSPQDPSAWTADQLSDQLLGQRHDLIFLAGHFSASSTLAADYSSRLLTTDLISSAVDLQNSLVFSVGCHSGYNIVDSHGVPGVTREPDWAQAFAQKGATLIAGTGYQYGDTDFIEYSERLYLEFSHQLRLGSGPVSIGKALTSAKQIYLANTPQMRGIHEKSVLQASLFGLPMLSVDMPNGRITPPADNSIITSTLAFGSNPGATLGLRYTDVSITPVLNTNSVTLDNPSDGSQVTAIYLSGTNGVVSNPVEPILPLESRNVSVPGYHLRGVGFRSGSYTDLNNQLLLTGAATTEARGVHTPFLTDTFYPVKFWGVNYYDVLAGDGDGIVRLNVIPAQFQSNEIDYTLGTLRKFEALDFRLYYSGNVDEYQDGSIPALSAAPTIARITSEIVNDQVNFKVYVVGNPAAGIQEVWVTYTALSGSFYGGWQSLDLVQNPNDSTLWEANLKLNGTSPEDVRFMVQAVNGVGLVALSTNLGLGYIPGVEAGERTPTDLALQALEPSAPYGTRSVFTALLTSGGSPLVDQLILFRLGSQTQIARTDADGRASVNFPLLGLPGDYDLRGYYPGSDIYAPASAASPFTIFKQDTQITLDPVTAIGKASDESLMVAKLADITGRTLAEKVVFFILTGEGTSYSEAVITDYAGRAVLGDIPLQSGDYIVEAYFSGEVPLPGGSITLLDDRYYPSSVAGSLILINPPVANDDEYTTLEDTALEIASPGVLDNDSDPDGDPISAYLVSGPTNGTLTLNPEGQFVYTPNQNYNGVDSFIYKANDGVSDSQPATVTITVEAINDAPVATKDSFTVSEDQSLTVSVPGVLANDLDVEGDALSVILIDGASNGQLSLNADGSFIYTPAVNFYGNDSFSYRVTDGSLQSGIAIVLITVSAVNDAPVAVDDEYTTSKNVTLVVTMPGILSNDQDADGDPLSAILVYGPTNGVLVLNQDGSFTYMPNQGFYGNDHFEYKVSDGTIASNNASVVITVEYTNSAPVCTDAYSSENSLWPPNGSFVPVYVLGVTDPDGDTVNISVTSIFQDEPVGNNGPDGIIRQGYAEVRQERDGNGNGRVYHISFLADDGQGGTCSGEIRVGVVPHDKGSTLDAIDDGAIYDSTQIE